MKKILISSCLLGGADRYNGSNLRIESELIEQWRTQGRIASFCPEVAAGLGTPRAAAEIRGGDGRCVLKGSARVQTASGEDLSANFMAGARLALELCRNQGIGVALLAESSPSCGSTRIYDGHFRQRKIEGVGVSTALLEQHGIRVFSQHQIEEAAKYLMTWTAP